MMTENPHTTRRARILSGRARRHHSARVDICEDTAVVGACGALRTRTVAHVVRQSAAHFELAPRCSSSGLAWATLRDPPLLSAHPFVIVIAASVILAMFVLAMIHILVRPLKGILWGKTMIAQKSH